MRQEITELLTEMGISANAGKLADAMLRGQETPDWWLCLHGRPPPPPSPIDTYAQMEQDEHILRCPACSAIAPLAFAPSSAAMQALRPMLSKFISAFEPFVDGSEAAEHRREQLFHSFTQSGYISLATMCQGIKLQLLRTWRADAEALFNRYYRALIRAFTDAKDNVSRETDARHDRYCDERYGRPLDEDAYVTRSEFADMLTCVCIYATWYEVFEYVISVSGRLMQAVSPPARRITQTHRVCADEWEQSLDDVHAAADPRRGGWAPYTRLIHATADDFEVRGARQARHRFKHATTR